MSLINDALKKAQRQRALEQSSDTAPITGAQPVSKRKQPLGAKTVLLIGAGALVLAVLSGVGTMLYLGDKPKTSATPAPKTHAPVAPTTTETPTIVVPTAAPPTDAVATNPTPKPVATAPTSEKPAESPAPKTEAPALAPIVEKTPDPAPVVTQAPAVVEPAPISTPPAPVVTTAAPARPTRPAVEAKPDDRIQAYVDAIRVTGIRSSGNDSKVLMNDRVYRVNDVVERTSGLKLTKVESDSLTFTDAAGFVYVKNF